LRFVVVVVVVFSPLRVITRHDKAFLWRREIWRIVAVVLSILLSIPKEKKEEKKFIGTLLLL